MLEGGGAATRSQTLSNEAVLSNWLKIKYRRIERRKRRVEWSSELRTREPQLPDVERSSNASMQKHREK